MAKIHWDKGESMRKEIKTELARSPTENKKTVKLTRVKIKESSYNALMPYSKPVGPGKGYGS